MQKVLQRQWEDVTPGVSRSHTTPEHAERVAWRILLDWLKVQLAIVESEQAQLDEVMLPYMVVSLKDWTRQSLYEGFRQTALPEPRP